MIVDLTGPISRGSVAADGTVRLEGTLLDQETQQGEGRTWKSNEPFWITLGGSLAPNEFLLRWCTLDEYTVRITDGELHIKTGTSNQMLAIRSGLSMRGCA